MANMINKEASPEASGLYNAINASGIIINALYLAITQNVETADNTERVNIHGMDTTTDLGGFTPWDVVRDQVKQGWEVCNHFTEDSHGYDTRINDLLFGTLEYISPVAAQAKTHRNNLAAFRNNVWQIVAYADTITDLYAGGNTTYIEQTFGIQTANVVTVHDRLNGAAKYARGETISAAERPSLAQLLWQTILRP